MYSGSVSLHYNVKRYYASYIFLGLNTFLNKIDFGRSVQTVFCGAVHVDISAAVLCKGALEAAQHAVVTLVNCKPG